MKKNSLYHEYDQGHRFTANDICHMHKVWLGGIYVWAGEYCRVNISKDDYTFAMTAQIPKLMGANRGCVPLYPINAVLAKNYFAAKVSGKQNAS